MGESGMQDFPGAESITIALIHELAAHAEVDPIRLSPPVNTVIDLDALEALFTSGNDSYVCVEFQYSGHTVIIEGDDDVQIEIE